MKDINVLAISLGLNIAATFWAITFWVRAIRNSHLAVTYLLSIFSIVGLLVIYVQVKALKEESAKEENNE